MDVRITRSSSCCYKHMRGDGSDGGGPGECASPWQSSLHLMHPSYPSSVSDSLFCLWSSQPVTVSSSVYTSFLSLTRPVILRHDVMGLGLLQGSEPRRDGCNQGPALCPASLERMAFSARGMFSSSNTTWALPHVFNMGHLLQNISIIMKLLCHVSSLVLRRLLWGNTVSVLFRYTNRGLHVDLYSRHVCTVCGKLYALHS